jgi:type IV pilus assembly protein PilM
MANFFQNLFGAFGNKGGQSVLGIDIGSSSIKVVQLRKKGARAVLETYGELALGPYANLSIGRATSLSSDSVAVALTDLLKESGTTTKSASISIPLGASLTTIIELPNLGAKEMEAIIPMEARKYIPVPITEVTLDWWIIPKSHDRDTSNSANTISKTEVLVIAIHNNVIQRYQEISSKSAISTSFLELEAFSTIRAVASGDIAPVMIFDMGAASTKLYVVEHGVIKSSHTINRGSQDITIGLSKALDISTEKAEQLKRTVGLSVLPEHKQVAEIIMLTLEYVIDETRRVLINYERKNNVNVTKVILTGGGVLLSNFFPLVKTSFESEVIYANPFTKLETPAFLGKILEQAGPEFAVAIGLALRKLQELD